MLARVAVVVARTAAKAVYKRAAKRAKTPQSNIMVARVLAEEDDEEEENKTTIELVKGGNITLIQTAQTDGTNMS